MKNNNYLKDNLNKERLIKAIISDIDGEYKYFPIPSSHVSPYEIYKKLYILEELMEQNKIKIL